MATFTHVGSITKTDEGGLTVNKVPPELLDVVKSSFSVTKLMKSSSRIGGKPKTPNSANAYPSLVSPKGPLSSRRKPMAPKKRSKAKQTLQQIWDTGRGMVTLQEAQSIVKAYDNNDDGKLDYVDAAPFIRDIIQIAGLTNQVMDYKPLIQDDESYVVAFVEIVFHEFDANQDGELEPYDLFHDHGFANFIATILNIHKSRLNPSRFPPSTTSTLTVPATSPSSNISPQSLSPTLSPTNSNRNSALVEPPATAGEMKMIHQTMIDYEYEETMTNLLDPEEYKRAFAQKAYNFTPRDSKTIPKDELDEDYE